MAALYLPIGPPGCGKSTLAEAMVANEMLSPHAIVSPDHYREVLTGTKASQKENHAVFAVCRKLIDGRLRNDLDVWVDATNLRSDWFGENVQAAKRHYAHVITVLFELDEAECLRRNAKRDQPVPGDVMRQMFEWYKQIDVGRLPGNVVSPYDLI